MAVTQKAVGIAWGMTSGITLTAAAQLKVNPLSANYQRNAKMVEAPNQDGETVGLIFSNQTNELDFRVYPSDSTVALGKTAGGTMGVSPGSRVVIVAADDPDIAGNYVCKKVSKARKVDHYVEFDITLCKWPTDITTDATP